MFNNIIIISQLHKNVYKIICRVQKSIQIHLTTTIGLNNSTSLNKARVQTIWCGCFTLFNYRRANNIAGCVKRFSAKANILKSCSGAKWVHMGNILTLKKKRKKKRAILES